MRAINYSFNIAERRSWDTRQNTSTIVVVVLKTGSRYSAMLIKKKLLEFGSWPQRTWINITHTHTCAQSRTSNIIELAFCSSSGSWCPFYSTKSVSRAKAGSPFNRNRFRDWNAPLFRSPSKFRVLQILFESTPRVQKGCESGRKAILRYWYRFAFSGRTISFLFTLYLIEIDVESLFRRGPRKISRFDSRAEEASI